MTEPILIVGNHGGFGGCTNLAEAINRHSTRFGPAHAITRLSHPYAGDEGLRVAKHFALVDGLFRKVERIFFCDWQGLLPVCEWMRRRGKSVAQWPLPRTPEWARLERWLATKRATFFWSGRRYTDRAKGPNVVCRRHGFQTFAMAGKRHRDPRALPLFQCFEFKPNGRKATPPEMSHSPGAKYAQNEKGTRTIERVFARLAAETGARARILKDAPNEEAIRLRGRATISVDHITKIGGGLGKSGMEAVGMGTASLCNLSTSNFSGRYDGCPVINVESGQDLYREARRLLTDDEHRLAVERRGLEWAKLVSYESTVAYLDEVMT